MPFFKLNEHINVAVRPKILAEDRPEQCKTPNVMSSTKCGNSFARYFDAVSNHDYHSSALSLFKIRVKP